MEVEGCGKRVSRQQGWWKPSVLLKDSELCLNALCEKLSPDKSFLASSVKYYETSSL